MSISSISRQTLIAGAAGLLMASSAFAEMVPLSVSPDAPTDVPEMFANGEANIAVVRQLNVGDVYQAWISGVEAEAAKLGVNLTIYNADGDNARQALQLQQAVATKPDAILIGWGFATAFRPDLPPPRPPAFRSLPATRQSRPPTMSPW